MKARARLVDSLLAFAGFAAVDLILATGGYSALQNVVRRWPLRTRSRNDDGSTAAICAALDRAALWYQRTRLCLARSAVTTCLLRHRGVDGRMIIGAKLMPFHAHAWVEVEGRVVTDAQMVRQRYAVLDTL